MKNRNIKIIYFSIFVFCNLLQAMNNLSDSSLTIKDVDFKTDSEDVVKLYQKNCQFLYPDPKKFSPDELKTEIKDKKIVSYQEFEQARLTPFSMKVMKKNAELAGIISFFCHRYKEDIVTPSECSFAQVYKSAIEKKDPCIGQIWMLMVDKKFRGKGYGEALIRSALDSLHQKTSFVCIYVLKDNEIAQKLYRKIGFQFIDEVKDDSPEAAVELFLGIKLKD